MLSRRALEVSSKSVDGFDFFKCNLKDYLMYGIQQPPTQKALNIFFEKIIREFFWYKKLLKWYKRNGKKFTKVIGKHLQE